MNMPVSSSGMSVPSSSSTSQFVKQELRTLCNARSQQQQPGGQPGDPLGMDFDSAGEIPMEILNQSKHPRLRL